MSIGIIEAGSIMLNQDYEEALKILLKEDKTKFKVVSMISECYKGIGLMSKHYETLWDYKLNDYSDYAFLTQENKEYVDNNISFYEYIGLHLLRPYDYSLKQSIETSHEEYPESNWVKEILYTKGKLDLKKISEFENCDLDEHYNQEKIMFALAETHFLYANNPGAIHYYMKAIEKNPNKALYWGYLANTYTKVGFKETQDYEMKKSYFITTVCAIEHAISLDAMNPRWYLYRMLGRFSIFQLLNKVEDVNKEVLCLMPGYKQLHQDMACAKKYLRKDQKSLKLAIEKYCNTIDDFFSE